MKTIRYGWGWDPKKSTTAELLKKEFRLDSHIMLDTGCLFDSLEEAKRDITERIRLIDEAMKNYEGPKYEINCEHYFFEIKIEVNVRKP